MKTKIKSVTHYTSYTTGIEIGTIMISKKNFPNERNQLNLRNNSKDCRDSKKSMPFKTIDNHVMTLK